MGVSFTVFKGSKTGDIVQATGHREPGPTEVIVKISHCGVCGTDEHYRHADQGLGHEGIGIIVEVGSSVHDVSDFRIGDRVGMGWFHKFCGHCRSCVSGCQNLCYNPKYYGTSDLDQGCFGTAVAWDVSAVFKIPDSIMSEDAGPLMCGGATVFAPLYESRACPGDRVGIIGLGGLGHLAIQFAAKMGLDAVVFSNTASKKQEALDFGAAEFHTTAELDKLTEIAPLNILLITASFNADLSLYLPLLAPGAKIYPLTISGEELAGISPLTLIMRGLSIVGSGVASACTHRAMLTFAAKHRVKPKIEKFPMTQDGITEALQRLKDGSVRYRGVLVTG
ncbi:NADP-dependent alcohol dehydrogenase [Xylariales sp. PMI_506]|nr:NADP-dependent alcohol dehydrogenase [Xylariales sp. PMI_506]